MIGLIVFLVCTIYLAVSIAVVVSVNFWAKRNGKRGWLWGVFAAIVMYNIVFWDLIPTKVLMAYYKNNQAGLFIETTHEEWMSAHKSYQSSESDIGELLPIIVVSKKPKKFITPLNSRFVVEHEEQPVWPGILRVDVALIDSSEKHEIARLIYFESGNCRDPQYLKPWISDCSGNHDVSRDRFWVLAIQFKKTREMK